MYKLQFFLHLFTITFDDLERLCQRILTFMGILSRKWQSFSGIYVYHLIGLVTCSTYCKNRENIRMIFYTGVGMENWRFQIDLYGYISNTV